MALWARLHLRGLPKADLDVVQTFINWVDDTPAARESLRGMGIRWHGRNER